MGQTDENRAERYQGNSVTMIRHRMYVFALCFFVAIVQATDDSVAIAASFDDEATILEVLINDERFDTLVLGFSKAEMAGELAIDGPFTLFAPTDDAFDNLPVDELDLLMADPEAVQATLRHHLLPVQLSVYDLAQAGSATTELGTSLTFIQHGDELMVDGAILERNTIIASNGVIYVINRVLIPPVDTPMPAEIATPTLADATTVETTPIVESTVISDRLEPASDFPEDSENAVGNPLNDAGRMLVFALLMLLLAVGLLAMLRRLG